MFDLDYVRGNFPALDSGDQAWAFLDNAGGTLMPRQVIDRARAYMERFQVQIGGTYPRAREAAACVSQGTAAVAHLFGCDPDEIILSGSTTANVFVLAQALRQHLKAGDEIIVSDLEHEANRGAWQRLRRDGIVVHAWPLRPGSTQLDSEAFARLLSPRTRLVCVTLCANVVGEVIDLKPIVKAAHDQGAWVCADAVAYAPHRRLDVRALNVDFCLVSLYKVFGPHQAALYGKRALLHALPGQNHAFFAQDAIPYKLQPGGVCHELVAALPGILDYLGDLHDHHYGKQRGDRWLDRIFAGIADHEKVLSDRLLQGVRSMPHVRVLGTTSNGLDERVAILNLCVDNHHASAVVEALEKRHLACRSGDFYAPTAIAHFGLTTQGGVVRFSLAHYNTVAEIDRVLAGLADLG